MPIYQQSMHFKEDSVQDFINYKLSNPQALQEEMKMIQDRQDCTRKLNQYAKQMESLKNQYNMCKELLQASVAKREYLQQTFQQNKEELDSKIAQCKEDIDSNNREVKERQIRNQYNRKRYNDFQRDIAIKKEKLTQYHLTQLTVLSNHSENLKKNIEQKRDRKVMLEQELKTLRDRQKIIQQGMDSSQIIKNKWLLKKKQLQKLRQEQIRKQKQIRDQISNAIAMQKVIYGNFYKRCAQITSQMKNNLQDLFGIDWMTIQGSNLDEKVQKLLNFQRASKQKILAYITEKREKYKINAALPEADAEVYNNIVETKINPSILKVINSSQFQNNDVLVKEIDDGLQQMLNNLEEEKNASLERQRQKINEINQLQDRVREFQAQIQNKRKQLLSPSKRSKKN